VIYISYLSKRIPILPAFLPAPYHLGNQTTAVPISDVFDLVGTSRALGLPMIEFHELKRMGLQAARTDRVIYDGEQWDSDGRRLEIGDELVAAKEGKDELYCWSYNQHTGGKGAVSPSFGDIGGWWCPTDNGLC
jgi:hypothetical protein